MHLEKPTIIIASSNRGKIKEIAAFSDAFHVIPYTDKIKAIDIEENATDFKGNAILKAEAVFNALGDNSAIVLADDSGLSVDALDGEPGIYSARYAGEDASDKENLHKVINALHAKGVTSSSAHYTAAIAIKTQQRILCVHGWMHGEMTTDIRGSNGFGYDPAFIPEGETQTLGELDSEIKKSLSHRSKALRLAMLLLRTIV